MYLVYTIIVHIKILWLFGFKFVVYFGDLGIIAEKAWHCLFVYFHFRLIYIIQKNLIV